MADAAPILLLSMPQMADPNFARTVVLLCDYTDEGAFGLVVNRQDGRTGLDAGQDRAARACRSRPETLDWRARRSAADVGADVGSAGTGRRAAARFVPVCCLSASKELTLQLLQTPPSPRARVSSATRAGRPASSIGKSPRRHG